MTTVISENALKRKCEEHGVRLTVVKPAHGINRFQFYHPTFGHREVEGSVQASVFISGFEAAVKMLEQG